LSRFQSWAELVGRSQKLESQVRIVRVVRGKNLEHCSCQKKIRRKKAKKGGMCAKFNKIV